MLELVESYRNDTYCINLMYEMKEGLQRIGTWLYVVILAWEKTKPEIQPQPSIFLISSCEELWLKENYTVTQSRNLFNMASQL